MQTDLGGGKVGICTVGIDGFWARLVCAMQILWRGEMTFQVSSENFIEEGDRA